MKTRLQKQVIHPGKEPKYRGLLQSCIVIAKEEGILALWKGITPRLLRIMPGQAITFMTYEAVSRKMNQFGLFLKIKTSNYREQNCTQNILTINSKFTLAHLHLN